MDEDIFLKPICGHTFCKSCWKYHTINRLHQRLDECCMDTDSNLILTGMSYCG